MVGRVFLGYEVMNMHSVGCLGGSVVLGGFDMQGRKVGHFDVMYSTFVRLMRQKSNI